MSTSFASPPTRHALDFLEAPDRLLSFLDASILRYFLRPYFVAGRLTLKVATKTGAVAIKLADRVLGLSFLQDLSEFFLAFESMYDGFKERAQTGHKRHKITDEDYRNRDKWPDYTQAANDMFARTSTDLAPWHLVAANDKRHARVQVLETLCKALKKHLD